MRESPLVTQQRVAMVAHALAHRIAVSLPETSVPLVRIKPDLPSLWNDLPPASQHQVAQMLATLIRRMPPKAPVTKEQLDVGYSEQS
jgi:hypothetical protein